MRRCFGFLVVCAVVLSGCGSSASGSSQSSSHAAPAQTVSSVANMGMGAPTSGMIGTFQGYYDGHLDTYVTTDASTAMLAHTLGQGVNSAPVLSRTKGAATPREFYVLGRRAPNQPVVFGSEPGESDYSPLWLVVEVHWKPGVKPEMLVKDDQIDELAKAGNLTEKAMPWVINSPITAVTKNTAPPATADGTLFGQGQPSQAPIKQFLAYYDGHKDTYVATDVSDPGQSKQLQVNAAKALTGVPPASAPRMFFVQGPAVAGQIAVMGSEPGESDYSPLWTEVLVHWKPGAHPVMLVRDDQIDALAKAGKLTETPTKIILNAPVTQVG